MPKEVAREIQDQLERIKKTVKNAYEAFQHNYERFNEFRRFTFDTSLTQDDITMLTMLSKPQLEFNINEAYISRLMGEFSKQEPSILVSAEDEDQVDPRCINVVESHIRHSLLDTKNHHTKWEIMKDLYSGGFSAAKLYTDYANSKSFKQVIGWDRVFDPTLCGWDQTAQYSHKGDGKFCFELFPYELEEFKELYPKTKTDKISFNRSFAGYNWSYLNGNEKIVLVADYYEKKKKKTKIVELITDEVMTLSEYEAFKESWNGFDQAPAIKGKPRWTTFETICRYRCIETEVLEYVETDFSIFPLIFFDGNSITIKNPKTSGAVKQMTRPYIYHAKGAQRLKNFAGISLANEIENTIQHKVIVAKEALPKEEDFLSAYKDIQKPSTYVFNAFFEQDPDKPIPNPIREVQRIPAPPEIMGTFAATDSLIQNILGSYDAALGINDNQLSGVAIIEAATQSNATAMPYVVGFLQGLQRVAEGFLDLIPKYYSTPRTIPVRSIDGKSSYIKINQPNGIDIYYDENVLNVKVEAGVSFQIQKSRALQQLIALQQSSPLFAQFMNEKGLSILLDNLEIKGIDQLKMLVQEWQQELAQQKAMQQQMQQQQSQNNPMMIRNQIEMEKLKQKQQESQLNAQVKEQEMQIDLARLKQDQLKVLSDIIVSKNNSATQVMKAQTEKFVKQLESSMKLKDLDHRHKKEKAQFAHQIYQNHLSNPGVKNETQNEQKTS